MTNKKRGMHLAITVDKETCNVCGICEDVCPRHIPEMITRDGKKTMTVSSERISLCMKCGHCVAFCPNNSIRVESLGNEDFSQANGFDINENQVIELLKNRRSIRRYKNKPVPREIIERIIESASCAPTGTSHVSTGVIVIDNRDTLSTLSRLIYELYEGLEKSLKNPIARFIIKRRIGSNIFRTLHDFVMPGMHWYIRWYREGRSNEIFRDCPALVLFHSPATEPMGAENCTIAAFHSIMMAEAMKIGTCFNDLIPPACNRSIEIKDLLGLSTDRGVYASFTMGYPRYTLQRIPPRKLFEIRYL